MLMHGFPYDIHSYVDVAPQLAAQGCRVIVPYLRGYGPTRFRDSRTPRSGEQAAVGADLIALMDALDLRGRCAAARALHRSGQRQFLSDPEYRRGHGSGECSV
jgi:pimeloyl-ACP methyl ester carboxylesterase